MIDENTVVMILDTETTNDIECPIVYDVGYQIFTLRDSVLCEKSFVNADVFLDRELMGSAFFLDKIPIYWDEITDGARELRKWKNIKKNLAKDVKEFGVSVVCAHNAAFDNRALNTTQRYLTCSKWRWFLPYGLEWWDTLKMSRQILKQNEDYSNFCLENNYITKNNQLRYTAEIIYRWLTDNVEFEEHHTGLEDVRIERKIFEYLVKQEPEIDGRLWKD